MLCTKTSNLKITVRILCRGQIIVFCSYILLYLFKTLICHLFRDLLEAAVSLEVRMGVRTGRLDLGWKQAMG